MTEMTARRYVAAGALLGLAWTVLLGLRAIVAETGGTPFLMLFFGPALLINGVVLIGSRRGRFFDATGDWVTLVAMNTFFTLIYVNQFVWTLMPMSMLALLGIAFAAVAIPFRLAAVRRLQRTRGGASL